jgi:hypothetical protein
MKTFFVIVKAPFRAIFMAAIFITYVLALLVSSRTRSELICEDYMED